MKVRTRESLTQLAGLIFVGSLFATRSLGHQDRWLIWLRDASWVLMMVGFWFTYRDKRHIPPTPNQILVLHAFIAVYLGAGIFYNRETPLALICLVPPFLFVLYRFAFLFRKGQRSRRADKPATQPLS